MPFSRSAVALLRPFPAMFLPHSSPVWAIEYFSAIDTKARTKHALGVTGIPHVVILDPDGIVRWEGFPLLDGYELTEAVVEVSPSRVTVTVARPADSLNM